VDTYVLTVSNQSTTTSYVTHTHTHSISIHLISRQNVDMLP
jgi:hypothetical protein